MSIGRIVVDLLAKTGSFETDLNRAGKLAEKRARQIDASLSKAAKAVGVAMGAAVVAVGAMVKQSIDAADRLNDISQRLGVGTEALSAWGYAAKQSGTDIEALSGGLTKFTKNMAMALDSSSRQGEIFAALGVSVKDAAGNLRSVEDIVPQVAQAFKDLNNATLESALAQELFGKSGAQLLQFLNLGADGLSEMEQKARDLGIIISQDTAQAADEFNDQLADLKAMIGGVATQLAAELLPALIQLVKDFRESAQSGGAVEIAMDAVRIGFETVTGVASILSNTLKGVIADLRAVASSGQAAWAVLTGNFAGATGFMKQAAADRAMAAQASASISRTMFGGPDFSNVQGTPRPDFSNVTSRPQNSGLEAALSKMFGGGAAKIKGGGKTKREGKSDAEKEAERLLESYNRLNASLSEQIALFGKDGEAAQLRYELEFGELAKLDPMKKAELVQMAERLDLMREESKVQEDLDAANAARAESVKQVLADIAFENELLGLTADQQERLNMLRYAGVDANSAYGQSIIDAATAMQENRKQTEAQIEIMDTFRSEAGNALADVVNGTKSLKDAFTDMFDNIAQRIVQMIADRWIEQLFGQMGSTGGGTSGGGWLESLAGALFGGARADGGPVMGGGQYLVGERGPELFVPRTAGSIVPAAQTARMMGGGGILNQTFVVQGTPDRRTREQMARDSGRAARRGMSRTG